MFALKDKRTNKFLRSFSGSYNDFHRKTYYKIREKLYKEQFNVKKVSVYDIYEFKPPNLSNQVHEAMWCLDTPNGAKIYKSKSGINTSFYSFCRRKNHTIPLQEALPWIEIVEVSITCK